MNRTLKTVIAAALLICPATQQAGGGKSAAIGIGSGIAGFMLGQATAQSNCQNYDCGYDNRYIERETVYIQEPPRTITVECPYLKRDLRVAQEQLARERSARRSLEAENAQLRANIARSERTNDYLAQKLQELEAEIMTLKATKVTTVVTTGHTCNAPSCPVKRTATPGIHNHEVTEKEQY